MLALVLGLALPLVTAAAQPGDNGQGNQPEAVADTDGDGLTDDVDNCAALANGDQLDSDGDGATNADEVIAGTDPTTADPAPAEPPAEQPAPPADPVAPAPEPEQPEEPEVTPDPEPAPPAQDAGAETAQPSTEG